MGTLALWITCKKQLTIHFSILLECYSSGKKRVPTQSDSKWGNEVLEPNLNLGRPWIPIPVAIASPGIQMV
jgi:hypothetical protein